MNRRLTRREALRHLGVWGAASLVGMGGCRTGAMAAARPRPNIVFIMADDHASHAMSCYGSRINKTPNIDRIAQQGVRLDNCFCTNSICAPSRAVILTGKYSHLNGVLNNRLKFDGSQQTFPKLLQQAKPNASSAGYQTAMVGKWHLKSEPTGFDYWKILPGQGAYHDPVMFEMGQKQNLKGYVTDLITDAAIDFIRNRDTDRPFCLMCHHKAPHRNWQPDAAHAHMYDDADVPTPDTFDDDYTGRGTAAKTAEMRVDQHLTPKDVKVDPPAGLSPAELKHWKYQRYIKDYLRVIASVDDNVGRLLDFLDEAGLAEDTVVIYTSDQGFYLGDHGWFDKRFMYEESLRMPFVMRYPREVQPGTTSDAMVLNVDFGPTFLDFAGAPIPDDMQGRSMRSVLQGRTPRDWRTSVYYQYYEYPAVHMVRRHYGVRTQRYKLIHYYNLKEWELFDLEKDPHELHSVCDDPAYSDVVTRLKQEIQRLRRELAVPEDTGA